MLLVKLLRKINEKIFNFLYFIVLILNMNKQGLFLPVCSLLSNLFGTRAVKRTI